MLKHELMRRSKPQKVTCNWKTSKNVGVVRIIGGQMRGRKLQFNPAEGLRPTLDRIRETLFNWLARDIQGSRCLDLFAGSGALGFEAASRGAALVSMIELNPGVANDLRANCQLVNVNNVKVVNLAADKFLQTNTEKYDVIFLDPPFGQGLLAETMLNLSNSLNPQALLYIEQETTQEPYQPGENWLPLKSKKTASFSYALYQLK